MPDTHPKSARRKLLFWTLLAFFIWSFGWYLSTKEEFQQERAKNNAQDEITAGVDEQGNTRLHAAAARGRVEDIRQMLKLGMAVDKPNRDGITPLMMSVQFGQTEAVEFLLGQGADINHKDSLGLTAVHLAVIQDNLPMLKLLKERGADLTIRASDGFTPRHRATQHGAENSFRWLEAEGAP